MTNEKLYELLGDVNEKQIREAGEYRKARRIGWRGWCAAAACLCLVVVGTLMLRNGSRANHKVTFDNGDTLIFAKADHAGTEQLATDADVETRTLTASESRRIFHELPVSGDACFDREEGCFVAFEGTINDVKLVITAPGETFKDIIIEGKETISEIDGTAVRAGYFITDENSRDERTIIYYADFKLGQYTVDVEHAGNVKESDTVKAVLADTVQALIANGEMDAEFALLEQK